MDNLIKVCNDGFVWLVISPEIAQKIWDASIFPLYILYDDDSEALIETDEELRNAISNGQMIGLEGDFLPKGIYTEDVRKGYYLDYLYLEIELYQSDIEKVPISGCADNVCAELADKPYIKRQFIGYTFERLKDAVCKLCDEPEVKTRQDAIMYIVWFTALSLQEEVQESENETNNKR